MSIEALSSVLHHSKAHGATLLVALGIANHQGDGGAYPSIATLAKYARCSERYVQLSVQQLIQLGELNVNPRAGVNGTNIYKIEIPCPDNCDRSTNHKTIKEGVNHASGGVNYSSSGGELRFTSGVNHASPKPSYNLNLTLSEIEKTKKDRADRKAQTKALFEDMEKAKQKAEPMPTCKHNKKLLLCKQCIEALAKESENKNNG